MENIFLMKLGDKSGVESLNFGEIISLKGEELGRFPLQAVLGSAGSFFGWFVPANTTYHIRVSNIYNLQKTIKKKALRVLILMNLLQELQF